MDGLRIKTLIVALMLTTSFAAAAREKPTVAIAREHTGDDCVSGILMVDGDFAGFAVALPYGGKTPLLSRLFPGTFDAQLKGNARDGWRIAFKPDPDGPAIRLRLGRAPIADANGIAIGDQLASECRFSKRSEYQHAAGAFEKRLHSFPHDGSGALPIHLTIEDR